MDEKLRELQEQVRQTCRRASAAAADAAYLASHQALRLMDSAKLRLHLAELENRRDRELCRVGQLVYATQTGDPTDSEQLLEQQPFDVLAIDESLMSSSGVDFCMAIRGRYPGMTRIVMTNAPTREIVDARSHGVIDGYVVKPVSASTLLAQIRSSRKE